MREERAVVLRRRYSWQLFSVVSICRFGYYVKCNSLSPFMLFYLNRIAVFCV
jgi:hypothetical protein